jgi:hypothetical protein
LLNQISPPISQWRQAREGDLKIGLRCAYATKTHYVVGKIFRVRPSHVWMETDFHNTVKFTLRSAGIYKSPLIGEMLYIEKTAAEIEAQRLEKEENRRLAGMAISASRVACEEEDYE